MYSSDGKGDFLSLSHLHFSHQSNLHFYGIINEEESHLHFLAHHHYNVWRTAVAEGTSAQKAQRTAEPFWGCRAELSSLVIVLSFFFRRDGRFAAVSTKSNRKEEREDEFFQVQIEATVCLLTSNTLSQASAAH